MMIGVAAAAVVVPAMLYTAMHPATVSNTVHSIAKHFPAKVKDIHIAIRAARETPTPAPSPTATAT
ncbi:MAG: hypothetical protein M3Z37_11550, partial [Candidatus Eremiobacteraeota bacterium]|nr:hypothetical protein [Candidatus Eremiobacteraeota bacterium]